MKKKILIVEDEPSLLRILKRMFTTKEYDAKYSLTGEDALNILDTFTPDLILLDIMLPGIQGTDVCRHVKKNRVFANTKVVMLTAKTSTDTIDLCYEVGASDFIRKPFLET